MIIRNVIGNGGKGRQEPSSTLQHIKFSSIGERLVGNKSINHIESEFRLISRDDMTSISHNQLEETCPRRIAYVSSNVGVVGSDSPDGAIT